jgi:hypothetical protein
MPTTPQNSQLSELVGVVANKVLHGTDRDDASQVAASAVQTLEHLTGHLAQLIGEAGVRALLARSAALASATFPWLAGTIPSVPPPGEPLAALRAAMADQDPRAISDGLGRLLSNFVELFGRLIGERLVAHLLHDVWPEVFPQVPKEST